MVEITEDDITLFRGDMMYLRGYISVSSHNPPNAYMDHLRELYDKLLDDFEQMVRGRDKPHGSITSTP